ncbi:hypothetical protein [Gorillibacterium sp. CAU 1737]|uniref:hypothetical protein n=1 Tax=Gorillibacterium sp. CAU 1737 TaxID=3140362 RepID=UPI00326113D3
MSRRRFPRWMGKEEGSVSVYLIVILLPIFFFQAVLVDFIRYEVAERETERAVKAAARSVMSEYETKLREYGLFGRSDDRDQMTQLFSALMAQNSYEPGALAGFAYLDASFQPESTHVSSMYSLANQVVFRNQVNEDMKYQAPIEFTLELVEKFKKNGAVEGMNATGELYENASGLESKWNDIQVELDGAWDEAQTFAKEAKKRSERYQQTYLELKELADKTGMTSVVDAQKSLEQIEQSMEQLQGSISRLGTDLQDAEKRLTDLQKDPKKNKDPIASLTDSIRTMRESLASLNQSLAKLVQDKQAVADLMRDLAAYTLKLEESKLLLPQDQAKLNELQQSLNGRINEAQKRNAELRKEKERLIAEASSKGGAASKIYESVQVLDEDYFMHYQIDSGRVLSIFNGLALKWQETTWFTGESGDAIHEAAKQAVQQPDEFLAKQGALEEKRKANRKERENQQQSTEAELEELLAQGRDFLGSGSNQAIYEQLNGTAKDRSTGLFAKYITFNSAGSIESGTSGLANAPYSSSRGSIKEAMGLGSRIEQLLTDARGELYLNEFALQHFSNRTSALADYADRSLAGQEAEYILYGFDSQLGNYSAAYGEMFTLLFAIRTVEALLDPKTEVLNIGSPLLVLLVAAVQGAKDAYLDMRKLLDNQAIPLIKKLPAMKVTYKDFLRVFFLLHSNDKKMMARMQALIEMDTGLDLTHQTTYIQARASSTYRVWFLKGIVSKLGGIELDGRYGKATATAVMTY